MGKKEHFVAQLALLLYIKANIGPKIATKLLKVFNRNTVKMSYSYINHVTYIISAKNKQISRPKITEMDVSLYMKQILHYIIMLRIARILNSRCQK